MAEDLRSGKNTLDYEWDSSDDRKRFADIVDKVAELKDICPAIQGSFALEVDIDDGNYHRHSPTLVISEDTIATTSDSEEDQEADKAIKELLKVLGKKEDEDDGECGGSCCRKCSKNKNC